MPLNGKKLSRHSGATYYLDTARNAHPAVYDPETLTTWYWPNITCGKNVDMAMGQAIRTLYNAKMEDGADPWDERTARWNIYPVTQYGLCNSPEDATVATDITATRGKRVTIVDHAEDLYNALEPIVKEIRAYQSPECDDPDAIGYAELKAADEAIARYKGRKGE